MNEPSFFDQSKDAPWPHTVLTNNGGSSRTFRPETLRLVLSGLESEKKEVSLGVGDLLPYCLAASPNTHCKIAFSSRAALLSEGQFGIRRDGQARSALRGALFRSIASGVSRRNWHLRQNTKALAYECASLGSRPPPLSAGPFFTSANVMAYYCDISRLIRYSRADRRNC